MNQDSFLQELRLHTHDAHKLLETTAVAQRILSSDLDAGIYAGYLTKQRSLHGAVEQLVFPQLGNLIADLNERRKLALIDKDLHLLGYPGAAAPDFIDEGFVADAEFCLGIVYVTEGSTLGGQLICRHVEKTLGGNGAVGTGFLNAYGAQTGSRWRTFLETLTQVAARSDAAGRQRIISGAIYGFERSYHVFSS